MTHSIPRFGIEIGFIDNSEGRPIERLSDAFMCDTISPMVNLLREVADKLEQVEKSL